MLWKSVLFNMTIDVIAVFDRDVANRKVTKSTTVGAPSVRD
jgi:hypothetical protein